MLFRSSQSLFYNEAVTNSFYIENCVILNMRGAQEPIFKNTFNCPITLKNCFTNCSLASSSGNKAQGNVILLGDNVFGTENPIDTTLLAGGGENFVLAKTNSEITLVDGSFNSWYFDDYGNFNKIKLEVPDEPAVGVITTPENAVLYTWNYNKESTTELWHKDVTPEPPYKLPGTAIEGMYKHAWSKRVDEDGSIVYTGGKIADFDIYVSAVYNGTLTFRIYIPAYVIDEGYLLYNEVLVADAAYYANEWIGITVDGEEYYYVDTLSIDEERFNTPFEVTLPCDFPEGKGQSSYVKTTWQIIPEVYVSRVLENAELYNEEALEVVREIAAAFMNSTNTENNEAHDNTEE